MLKSDNMSISENVKLYYIPTSRNLISLIKFEKNY